MTPEEREAAWFAVHDALPPGWRGGPCEYHPGKHARTVAAVAPVRRRGQIPASVEGLGSDELAAVRDLVERLRRATGL